jgi:predicted GIY-YIG superfamily endonuclease
MNMFYVYVLKSDKDGSLYIGYTDDLKRRLVEHNDVKNVSTKNLFSSSTTKLTNRELMPGIGRTC